MPVLNLSSVLFGLAMLLTSPNVDDPLNKKAADEYVADQARFEQNVARSLRGNSVHGRSFPKLLK